MRFSLSYIFLISFLLFCNCIIYRKIDYNPSWLNFHLAQSFKGKKDILKKFNIDKNSVTISPIKKKKGALFFIYYKDSLCKIVPVILDPYLPDTFYSMRIFSEVSLIENYCIQRSEKDELYKIIKNNWLTKTYQSSDSIAIRISKYFSKYNCKVKIKPMRILLFSITNNYKGSISNGFILNWDIITDNRMRFLSFSAHSIGKHSTSFQ
jgi:hypothetical protein